MMPVGFPEPIESKCVSLRVLRTGNPIPPLWQSFPKSTWYRRQSFLANLDDPIVGRRCGWEIVEK